jgi:RimJ/RimL family protein N-acetyltransferase
MGYEWTGNVRRPRDAFARQSQAFDAPAGARVACGFRMNCRLDRVAPPDDDAPMPTASVASNHCVLTSARLRLRELGPDDAAFMLELLNDADFLQHIGDRGVRSLEQARQYIVDGAMASYREHGFGLWCVEPRDAAISIGICGLVRRDYLDAVDIGYAFLPAWRGRGLALEAGQAVMTHAQDQLGLHRILAIVSADNVASAQLLTRLGLRFERLLRRDDEVLRVYAWIRPRDGNGEWGMEKGSSGSLA